MKVTLAYPYKGHAADDTIEVTAAVGRTLLESGRARKPADDQPTPQVVDDNPAPSTTTTPYGVDPEEA